MCQQSRVRGACSTVCPPTPEDDGIGGSKGKGCRMRGVTESRGTSPPPTPPPPPPPLTHPPQPHQHPLRKKYRALKSKSGPTAPPQLVGEFVLKWKWGWWRTWRLAPRLTWKERKRQLLIFSFDLWLPLVFHTNADLWRSLTAHCYWRDYRKRKRERRGERKKKLTPRTHSISIHSFHLFVSISVLFALYVLRLSPIYLFVDFPLFLSVCLGGLPTLYLFPSLFAVWLCLSFIISTLRPPPLVCFIYISSEISIRSTLGIGMRLVCAVSHSFPRLPLKHWPSKNKPRHPDAPWCRNEKDDTLFWT